MRALIRRSRTAGPSTGPDDYVRLSRRTRRTLESNRVAIDNARTTAKIEEITRKAGAKQVDDERSRQADTMADRRARELHRRAGRLTGVAGFVAVVSLVVTAAAQTMFYTSLPWSNVYKVIAFVMFGFVEGPAWYFALNARDLADRGMPYAASGRRVWVFALTAAIMNGYHGYDLFGRVDMGVILGLPSLIGPYVWHRHVHRLEMLASQQSASEARANAWRKIHHPVLSWRALKRWAEVGGSIRAELAFLQVFYEAHGHFPGQNPARKRTPIQVRHVSGVVGALVGTVIGVDLHDAVIPFSWFTAALIGAVSGAAAGTVLMPSSKFGSDNGDHHDGPTEQRDRTSPVGAQGPTDQPQRSKVESHVDGEPVTGLLNGSAPSRNVDRVHDWVQAQVALGRDLSEITGTEVQEALNLPNSSARNALRRVKLQHGVV